jgi:hypothetical protein
MSRRMGQVQSSAQGVTYFIHDADDVTEVEGPKNSGVTATPWKLREQSQRSYSVLVPAELCVPKPGLGLRPASPIKLTLKVGKGKTETVTLE